MLTVGGEFDGIGLLAYGLHLAGLQHRWLCEVDPWRRSILAQRWPGVPVFDDIRAVDARAERVDVIAGGFPCKGASTAGKRNGFDHPETVLWREMARTIRELRPRYVLVENVANILGLHDGAVWGEVVGDLAALGYDVTWDCLPAAAVGAPHLRDRVLAIAAYTGGIGWPGEGRRWGVEREERTPGAHGEAAAHPDGASQRRDRDERRESDGRADARRGGEAPANTGRDRLRLESEPERGRGSAPFSPGPGAPAPDAEGKRWAAPADRDGGRGVLEASGAAARGVAVDWLDFEPAIRRWETIVGPAPKPLVRRVDDRGAARMERSRLSALGDGVQVQVGQLAGAYIVELERQRLMTLDQEEEAADVA